MPVGGSAQQIGGDAGRDGVQARLEIGEQPLRQQGEGFAAARTPEAEELDAVPLPVEQRPAATLAMEVPAALMLAARTSRRAGVEDGARIFKVSLESRGEGDYIRNKPLFVVGVVVANSP